MTNKQPWWRKPHRNDDDFDREKNDLDDKKYEDSEYLDQRDHDRFRLKRLADDDIDSFFSRSPFGLRDDFFSDIEREFGDMHRRMDHLFHQAAEGKLQPGEGGPFVYGFSMRTGPDGIPHVQEFGNMPPELRGRFRETRSLPFTSEGELNEAYKTSLCSTGACSPFGNRAGGGLTNNTRKPLTDVLDCDDHISITVELPGVEKPDINLEIIDDKLELNVESPIRKYYDKIPLSTEVDPGTISASYNNGVLEVCVKRLEPKKRTGKKIEIK